MRAEEAAALAAIAATFNDPVFYTGAGLAGALVAAIRSEEPAQDFAGPGRTVRQISYEIQMDALPRRPSKTDTFENSRLVAGVYVPAGTVWRVNDITELDDVAAWRLIVVKA